MPRGNMKHYYGDNMENQSSNLKAKAAARLIAEITKGKSSGEKDGCVSADGVRKHLEELKTNKPE